MNRLRLLLLVFAVLGSTNAMAQQRLNFVSCPIVRDTSTVPCWLTEYEGELYYMGIQTDVSAQFQPPFLGHQVLVEASVADDRKRICGGIVLEPIRISVMPELDGSCNTILPAEDQYVIDFNPRPPGPSGGRLAFAPPPGQSSAPAPAPPQGPKTFDLYFDVDRAIAFRHPARIQEIHDYAQAIDARRIVVTGYRGSTLLSNGERLIETDGIAARRAGQVAKLLQGLQPDAQVQVESRNRPVRADGVDDWMSRTVTVQVEP